MTNFHMNSIPGEPGAAKDSFPGSFHTRLSDPDNEVGAASRDKKKGKAPVKTVLVNEFHTHLICPTSDGNEKQSFWPVGKYAAL